MTAVGLSFWFLQPYYSVVHACWGLSLEVSLEQHKSAGSARNQAEDL